MPQPVIFLTGPIGVGKTTLGRALAVALDGTHIEGDDFQLPDRPWYAASLRVARGTVEAAITAPAPAVVNYPLRCIDYLYLRGRLAERGLPSIFVNLSLPADRIMAANRGRAFTFWERARIREMIAQGYADRPWTDARVDTSGSAEESLGALVAAVDALLRRRSSSSPPLGR